jgi:hypothetical protein
LPRLKEFDWRIDIKTSSDKMARMSSSTAIVTMAVQDMATSSDEMPSLRHVAFEVNKVRRVAAGGGWRRAGSILPPIDMACAQDTLETVLDGLSKIQEQLASVAAASQ